MTPNASLTPAWLVIRPPALFIGRQWKKSTKMSTEEANHVKSWLDKAASLMRSRKEQFRLMARLPHTR